jgi:hypothetical protein
VIGVDLECRLQFRQVLLTHGLHHLAHAGRRLVFVGNDDGGTVGESQGGTHLFHGCAQRGLDLFKQGHEFFGLIGCGVVLEIFGGRGLVDGFQVDVAELGDGRKDDLVDIVVENEDLDALLLVDLHEGRVAKHGLGGASDVVERLLLGLHALLGLGERGESFNLSGFEADEVEQLLAVGEVAVETFLEWTVVLGDELRVLLGIVGGDGLQLGKDLFDAGGLDTGEYFVLLQDLARDVEREVFGVDDAADKAKVLGKQVLGIIHDEDAPDVELDAALVVGLVEIERSLGRNVEEGGVLERAFGAGMEPGHRIFPVAGDGLVELLVVVVLELGLGALPHRASGIDRLGGAGLDGLLLLGVPLAFVVSEENGKGYVVGVLLDDLCETPAVGVLCTFVIEVDEDGCPGALARCNEEVRNEEVALRKK